MALEAAALAAQGEAEVGPPSGSLPLIAPHGGPAILDWEPLVSYLLGESPLGVSPSALAARFHAALAEGILAVARHAGARRVALTGGCFQNRLLTELTVARLEAGGFETLLHGAVPPNDGGIAVGQVLVAAAALKHLHRRG
jgi:hydrogenase maturation protein HypF